ncbi:helix-turn-helix transcriptional regulator [Adlercreutzia sp. ZJ176]|nr:helix-turn-helix transcriptional regulator [Adlercreutzia sp. ZJ176]
MQQTTVKPNVVNFGYATFLSIGATSIWGGVFPYLADVYRTSSTTTAFYLLQGTAMCLAFVCAMRMAWTHPRYVTDAHVWSFSVPLALGPVLLIAAMYLEVATPALVAIAALLVGGGLAGYMISWQRVFASLDSAQGTAALISGTAYSAVLYFTLCLIPAALCAYLIPLVLVPLAGLCLSLAARQTSSDQPMFEDVPCEHAAVYRNVIRKSLAGALSVGALGFCAGAARFIAITHQELLNIINISSMFSLLVAVALFYRIWRTRTITFSLTAFYRVLFPVAALCMIILPFAGRSFVGAGIAVTHACFMLACVLMMMLCAQISRDSGINPVFIYAIYALFAYALQTLGYVVGFASGLASSVGLEQLSLVGLLSLFVLLVASLAGRKDPELHTDRLEFITLAETASSGSEPIPMPEPRAEEPAVDRLASQCRAVSSRYGLTTRETEVMELIARGHSGPAIAEMLFISENTMRTHSKRIYAKLGIHKKQELIVLLEGFAAR